MRTMFTLALTFALAMLLGGSLLAGDAKTAFLDAESAGPDFLVQGEYLGVPDAKDDNIWGVQVIALGDAKFDAVAYPGGLPGAGADMSMAVQGSGETQDGVTTLTFSIPAKEGEPAAPSVIGVIEDGVMTCTMDGEPLGVLKKTLRESPTLGTKPPAGAVVLFDGTSLDAFKGGRITDDGLLMEGVTSNQLFTDFTIHLEFRTPFMPWARGQGRGNSGFYAQGRYETQILDSFGLSGEDNECGGVYKIAKPKVNMCLPPLSWQTYDIDFTAAKFNEAGEKVKDALFTVRHNGVLVHENQPLGHATTAAPMKEGPEPGPIYLQNHGNPVRYRNIWVVPREEAAVNTLTDAEKADGFKLLFNGENLDGWQGATDGYFAQDGLLICREGGNLYTDKEYENFVLRFNVRIPENGNNGVGIRTPMGVDAAYGGMEIQILDDEGDRYTQLQPYQYHGSIYGVVPAKRGFQKPVGEWNSEEIKADGSKITITLNGQVIVDADIADIEETADHREHPGLHNPKGYIGFLGHGARIEWNTIRVKELP